MRQLLRVVCKKESQGLCFLTTIRLEYDDDDGDDDFISLLLFPMLGDSI